MLMGKLRRLSQTALSHKRIQVLHTEHTGGLSCQASGTDNRYVQMSGKQD
jgi:hypothetical protein